MPLIKCIDCQNMISDSATACIHCGRPLKSNNITKIKMPSIFKDFPHGGSWRSKMSITNSATGNIIFNGTDGEVVNLTISDKTEISVLIKNGIIKWSGNYTIYPNKRYQLYMQKNILGGWKYKVPPILTEVDVIDSD